MELFLYLYLFTRRCILSAAPEDEWNKVLINGLTLGKGDVSPEELDAVIKKRIERTLIRTVRSLTNIDSSYLLWPPYLFHPCPFRRREDPTSSVF